MLAKSKNKLAVSCKIISYFLSFKILVGSSMGGWLMLHAAIARPDKVAALVGVAVAADHLVTTFKKLPIEVNADGWLLCNLKKKIYQAFKKFCCSNCTLTASLLVIFLCLQWR